MFSVKLVCSVLLVAVLGIPLFAQSVSKEIVETPATAQTPAATLTHVHLFYFTYQIPFTFTSYYNNGSSWAVAPTFSGGGSIVATLASAIDAGSSSDTYESVDNFASAGLNAQVGYNTTTSKPMLVLGIVCNLGPVGINFGWDTLNSGNLVIGFGSKLESASLAKDQAWFAKKLDW